MNRVGHWMCSGVAAALAAVAVGAGAAGLATLGADAGAGAGTEFTVQQILERHVAARGGAEAWHKVQTMGPGRAVSNPDPAAFPSTPS
jgi:hypothetical protein